MSRRQFVRGASATGAALALGACGVEFAGERPLAQSSSNLRIINWPEYIDPATLPRIESELGLSLTYDEIYQDNVSGLAEFIEPQLSNGGVPNFDLINPTNWVAQRMIDNGWVEALPLEAIPNHVNIDPAFLTNDWDRGSRFQMPWQGGITGISYDPSRVGSEISSISSLFDPLLSGRVGLVGEMREAVGLTMLQRGDDPSRPTFATASAAVDMLLRAVERGQFGAIVFDDFVGRLQAGNLDASMAWSGQAAALALEDPSFEYVIPDEGAISWFDTMVIPRGATNFANAARWMNWAYDPVNAAEISAFNLYVSPVLGTQSALSTQGADGIELAANPLVFPDADTRNRLFTWGSMDLQEELQIEAQFDELFGFFDDDLTFIR